MAYLFGIWGCFIVFAAAGLSRLLVVRRMREELGLVAGTSIGVAEDENANLIDLTKEHKARFPRSKTRNLSNALNVVVVLTAGTAVTLAIAAQFQPHSLFHLISAAR